MDDIKTILVPVDGSEGSNKAVDFAITLAQAYKAKLEFLYIANINQMAINACLSDAILDAVTKAGDAILDKALAEVPHDVPAEAFSETGSPSVTILEFAEENKNNITIVT